MGYTLSHEEIYNKLDSLIKIYKISIVENF